jgi:hypothetical protein
MKRKKYSYIGARFSGKEVEAVDAVNKKPEKKKYEKPKTDERKKSYFSHENHDDLFDNAENNC